MQIRQCTGVTAETADAVEVSKLEANVIAALVLQHAAQGYSVVQFNVYREPHCDMITATLVMARGEREG